MRKDTDEMTILECINEMTERGYDDKAVTWEDASYNARNWNEHATIVESARRALDNIRESAHE